ncbi:MAG: hypothetical protein, partial [Olavius algarvensis Gamma 1 endosymbiont]
WRKRMRKSFCQNGSPCFISVLETSSFPAIFRPKGYGFFLASEKARSLFRFHLVCWNLPPKCNGGIRSFLKLPTRTTITKDRKPCR